MLNDEMYDDRPESAKRLEAARIARGFKTASDAARYFGWNYQSYLQHESGIRGLSRVAEKYAKAFKVPIGWVLFGEGEGPNPTTPQIKQIPAWEIALTKALKKAKSENADPKLVHTIVSEYFSGQNTDIAELLQQISRVANNPKSLAVFLEGISQVAGQQDKNALAQIYTQNKKA